jgi:hypothetical protein
LLCCAGKLFYHITSTQAAAGANTEEDRQRLRQGLVLMLKALANSFQQWLERQSPARVQHHKDLVELRQQQRRQRNQQRLRSELQQRQLTDMRSLPSAALAVGPVAPAAWAAATPAEAGSGARAAAVASDELQLLPQSLQAAAAAAGALVAQPGRSGPSGAAAGGSRPVQGSVAVSEDVLWFLERYMIFHTEWRSSRASSPPYNGALLQEVVVELFGFSPRHTAL